MWKFLREDLPQSGKIAYTNTYLVYPLMGFRYWHELVHVPTRGDFEAFASMPRIEGRIAGEEIPKRIAAMLREKPDREAWLRRLRRSGAEYLVVVKQDPAEPSRFMRPVELDWAQTDAKEFERVFDNVAGSVFRIRWEP